MTETAIATTAKQPVALGGQQTDLDQTYRLAQALSQAQMLPDSLRGKPSDVLAAILYGQELGIAPMQAINSIYVVKGRPTISANLWVALARRAGHKVRVVEETAESCTVAIERADDPGQPTSVTYTLAQAKQAGLTNKDTWKQNPGAMLYARAASTACRRACPEIAMGFGDETERDPEPARPSLAQVAAQRDDHPPETETVQPVAEQPAEPADDTQETDMLAELAEIEQENAADDTAYADDLFAGDEGGGQS